MKIIKTPPKTLFNPLGDVIEKHMDQLPKYLTMHRPVDEKGRYLHFDEFRYRVPKGMDPDLCWSLTKQARTAQSKFLMDMGEPATACHYYLSPSIQKAQSFCDRYASDSALELMSQKMGEARQFEYLINDLIEDEAISSSQLEGAATTTKRAKELISQIITPRTPDERMIMGNFKMMNFAWVNRAEKLTPELIMAIHKIGVEGIDDDKYYPGAFRVDDDVVVQGRDGEVLHEPPAAANLYRRIKQLCDWLNCSHDEADSAEYIHPMIKAMALHFSIGYEHPFRDGNGRVARSLFYWFMFKSGFATFRYIAISTLLKNAPVQYGKSYLYTETDEMDMTYFLDYQSQILLKAIKQFQDVYQQTLLQLAQFDAWVWESGLNNKLNANQKVIFQVAKTRNIAFTARSVQHNLNVAYGTAATSLKGLEELGLFYSIKQGRNNIYYLKDKKELVANWSV